MNHLVLLGDSVFDNAVYVDTGQDVRSQLQRRLSPAWVVTLLAKDGSMTDSIAAQFERLPSNATHLILSVGGNDAIAQMGLLDAPVSSVVEAMAMMAVVSTEFSQRYEATLQTLLKPGLRLTLCTIYHPRLTDPNLQRVATTALALYNDCIVRSAVLNRVDVLDLRFICDEDADFSHEIEPSAVGGAKIARAIHRCLAESGQSDNGTTYTQMFV